MSSSDAMSNSNTFRIQMTADTLRLVRAYLDLPLDERARLLAAVENARAHHRKNSQEFRAFMLRVHYAPPDALPA